MVEQVACWVMAAILVVLIPINLYARQRDTQWKVRFNAEQAKRKRTQDIEEIRKLLQREASGDE